MIYCVYQPAQKWLKDTEVQKPGRLTTFRQEQLQFIYITKQQVLNSGLW
jgi:hypothetical protein